MAEYQAPIEADRRYVVRVRRRFEQDGHEFLPHPSRSYRVWGDMVTALGDAVLSAEPTDEVRAPAEPAPEEV